MAAKDAAQVVRFRHSLEIRREAFRCVAEYVDRLLFRLKGEVFLEPSKLPRRTVALDVAGLRNQRDKMTAAVIPRVAVRAEDIHKIAHAGRIVSVVPAETSMERLLPDVQNSLLDGEQILWQAVGCQVAGKNSKGRAF